MVANIFGQIFAVKGKLRAQQEVSRITREVTKITRDIGRLTKQMSQNKRMELNAAKQQYSVFGQAQISAGLAQDSKFASIFTNGVLDFKKAQTEEGQIIYKEYNQAVQTQTMMAQNSLQQTLDEIENKYEQYQELVIEPLNEEEADLKEQKTVAEARMEEFKGMEQQEKQFAQDNIKGMFS
ncbi:MAG: hypothetical protein NC390_00345 [Fusobacterium sp.]|nr:hypothetical protein [Fusobacterium sp.]